jgi:multidrug efflux pump subunit AcrA (membrane-fusion protein)
VALEDGIQRAKTEIARRDAESTLAIEFAKVRWDHSERALERLVGLHGNDYASNKELSDAWADREMRRVEHALAQWEHQQAVGSFERERETLRAFQILAPFDGVVSAHHRHVGETVDVGEPILTLARLDPLEVVLDVPLALSREIREGGEVAVQPLGAMGPALTGVVTCKSRVADAASQTLKTKITVPDRDGQWIAGTKVIVDFRFPGVPATVAPSAGGFVRPGSE